MDSHKIAIKLFAVGAAPDRAPFMPIFQRWIQAAALPDHMLIDVADYAHVHAGPGTVLVSAQANLCTDRGDGQFGLLYARKLPLQGTFRDRLRQTLAATLQAALLLEAEPALAGQLRFDGGHWLLRINDRLLAPNTAQTWADVKPDLEAVAKVLYADKPAALAYEPSPLTLFQVRVKAAAAPPLQTLRQRLMQS
jgi:hypothetical protein